MQSGVNAAIRPKQNRHLPLSESVTACTAHPFDGTIVAGTKVHMSSFTSHISKLAHYFELRVVSLLNFTSETDSSVLCFCYGHNLLVLGLI